MVLLIPIMVFIYYSTRLILYVLMFDLFMIGTSCITVTLVSAICMPFSMLLAFIGAGVYVNASLLLTYYNV